MMKIVLVTGSAGLIGSESVSFFVERGFTVVGLDNNMRQTFFGQDASTDWNRDRLVQEYPHHYKHFNLDIRDRPAGGEWNSALDAGADNSRVAGDRA